MPLRKTTENSKSVLEVMAPMLPVQPGGGAIQYLAPDSNMCELLHTTENLLCEGELGERRNGSFRLRQINRNLQNSWFQGLTFLCVNGGYGNVQLLQGCVDIILKTVGLLPIGRMVRTEQYLVCPYR